MPSITALIHTNNDALRLGRILETLYPCDEIVIVDHGSRDATVHIAREYGARVIGVKAAVSRERPLPLPTGLAGWILCLDPREALTEGLAASLFEWKTEAVTASAFSVYLREETSEGWIENPEAQTRLVPAQWKHWSRFFPSPDRSAVALEGELLRFALP
jgi:glycosyltransferase involved in cell wall biosynthesis